MSNRTGCDATELLDTLANENLVELRNYGDKWGIIYRTGQGGECGELVSADFDNLLSVWADKCHQALRERYQRGDEGVYEQTAGIAPNESGEQAYEPYQPHLHGDARINIKAGVLTVDMSGGQ
jgi:hypothetical protein